MLRIAPTSWKPARLLEVSRAKAKGLDVRARVEAFVRRRAPAPAEIALPGAGGIYDISEGETLAFALRAARAAALAAGEASNSPDLQPPRASTDAVFETLPALEPGDAGLRSFACASFGVAPDRLTLQPAADGGPTKGMTDSEVLLVRADDRVVGVVKRTTWRKELARELWSFSVLPRHQTHEARFPSLVAAAQLPTEAGGRVGVLAMSLAEGTPLDDRLAALARATDVREREGLLEELELDVAKIGRALASLHRQPLPPGDATPFLNHHLELERQVLEQYGGMTALFERSGFRLEPYQARLATLAAAARSNPGQPSLGHGDVHPGNLFISDRPGAAFIDNSTAFFTVDPEGRARGMPALDVENLFAQLDMIAVDELGLPEDVSARLQASLERSYLASGPELTAEARAYFRAWCSSDRLLHAVRRHGADLDSPAARRDTERQLQKMWESAGLSG